MRSNVGILYRTGGSRKPSIFLISAVALLAALAGVLGGQGWFNVQTIIVAVAGLVTLGLLTKGGNSHWVLLHMGVASLLFGRRGVYLGQTTFVVPLQVIVGLLWSVSVANAIVLHEKIYVKLPALLTVFSGWAVLRAGVAIISGIHWDGVLAWTIPHVSGFFTFWVIGSIVKKETQLRAMLGMFLRLSLLVSLLGSFEFFFPSVARGVLPWFFDSSRVVSTTFPRARFGFWGSPSAVIIVVWGMLIAYNRLFSTKELPWFDVCVLLFGAVAVYISGLRAAWIGLLGGFTLLSWSLSKWAAVAWLGIGASLFTSNYLPDVFWNRLLTIPTAVLTKTAADTSIASRFARWQWAWEAAREYPLEGIGYGHWQIHNSFLEVASKIGLIPALIFTVFFMQVLMRNLRTWRKGPTPEVRHYGLLFTAFGLTWIPQVATSTVFYNSLYSIMHWTVMALGWYLVDICRGEQAVQVAAQSSPALEGAKPRNSATDEHSLC